MKTPKITPFEFHWTPSSTSPNPTCLVLEHPNYSAYVLIPYNSVEKEPYDPENGIGLWNAVANCKGKMGLPSREAAIAHCEAVIRKDAEIAMRNALNSLAKWTGFRFDPHCPACGDTGKCDSGGTHPWGETIYLDCDCIGNELQQSSTSQIGPKHV